MPITPSRRNIWPITPARRNFWTITPARRNFPPVTPSRLFFPNHAIKPSFSQSRYHAQFSSQSLLHARFFRDYAILRLFSSITPSRPFIFAITPQKMAHTHTHTHPKTYTYNHTPSHSHTNRYSFSQLFTMSSPLATRLIESTLFFAIYLVNFSFCCDISGCDVSGYVAIYLVNCDISG